MVTEIEPDGMTVRPALDPGFVPAVLWNRAYRKRVAADPQSRPLVIALQRPDGTCFTHEADILPDRTEHFAANLRFVERMVKFLLWQKGGTRIFIAGGERIAAELAGIYSAGGARAFDCDLFGRKMFRETLKVESVRIPELPEPRESSVRLGRHLDGCRIGFDLGGSDRKSAALIDGKLVYSEEIPWDPYFQSDPQYHRDGINDTLRRAADKLPRVDAIGGSAAGCYANNEVLVASLFRGVSEEDFERKIRRIFPELKAAWGNVPFEVANDGEVAALAGSMAIDDNSVLGISMGTSQAAGYVNPEGNITSWLNELAFVPVDYRDDAPVDEWSGDRGCGVQYFSQQAVARLAETAGLDFEGDMPFAERLAEVQHLLVQGDERARRIFETIGVYFGYSIAHYAEFYEIGNLLILGRVTSGEGGEVIIERAGGVLRELFPELHDKIALRTPGEKDKRHGQAIAAASLPEIERRPAMGTGLA